MSGRRDGGLWAVLAWMAFPALPVVLENAYSGFLSFGPSAADDPRDWNWLVWLTELGPLVGFGYLAGATLDLPDDSNGRRWPRAWLSQRWFWVAVGPWAGFVVGVAVVWAGFFVGLLSKLDEMLRGTWAATVLYWPTCVFAVATLCYGWLWFAFAAFRRAREMGKAWESVRRGVAVSAAFVGSLFGSFWAVTEWWRSFFFDARVFPVVLIAAFALVAASGCGGPVTYGEVRRRDLFHAMLLAWTIGLALIWRWWARPRSGSGPTG